MPDRATVNLNAVELEMEHTEAKNRQMRTK